jgi:hypothetical protein
LHQPIEQADSLPPGANDRISSIRVRRARGGSGNTGSSVETPVAVGFDAHSCAKSPSEPNGLWS